MSVSQPEILPRIQAEQPSRRLGLGGAAFDRTACSHFAACHVQNSGPITKFLELYQRTADAQFGVVRMCEHTENIDLFHVFNLTY